MATYLELFGLASDSDLQDRIAVALVIAAEAKLSGTPTAAEAAWAQNVLRNPGSESHAVINAVLAANKAATVAAIQGATDAQVQANVDDVVDGLILGE